MMNYRRGQQVVVETYGEKYQVGTITDIQPGKIITYHLKMESGKELMAWNSTKQLPRIKSLFHEGNVI